MYTDSFHPGVIVEIQTIRTFGPLTLFMVLDPRTKILEVVLV